MNTTNEELRKNTTFKYPSSRSVVAQWGAVTSHTQSQWQEPENPGSGDRDTSVQATFQTLFSPNFQNQFPE